MRARSVLGLATAVLLLCIVSAYVSGSARAGTLVFSSSGRTEGNPATSLWTADDAGGPPRQLIGPGGEPIRGLQPTWAPDGSQIAYASVESLRSVRVDGSGDRELIGGVTDGQSNYYGDPSWSPDGRLITFVSSRPDGRGCAPPQICSGVFVVNADGSGVRVLSAEPGGERSPYFSPDGQRVIFWRDTADRFDTGWYSVALDGSDERPVAVGTTEGIEADFLFSPDGRHLALLSDWRLWTLRADGTGIRLRTPDTRLTSFGTGALAWSADSQTLFFTALTGFASLVGPDAVLHRLDLSQPDAGPRPVTRPPGFDVDPEWTDGSGRSTAPTPAQPPATVLLDGKGQPIPHTASFGAAAHGGAYASVSRSRLGFLALDRDGVRRVRVAIGRRQPRRRSRCRFLRSTRLTSHGRVRSPSS